MLPISRFNYFWKCYKIGNIFIHLFQFLFLKNNIFCITSFNQSLRGYLTSRNSISSFIYWKKSVTSKFNFYHDFWMMEISEMFFYNFYEWKIFRVSNLSYRCWLIPTKHFWHLYCITRKLLARLMGFFQFRNSLWIRIIVTMMFYNLTTFLFLWIYLFVQVFNDLITREKQSSHISSHEDLELRILISIHILG